MGLDHSKGGRMKVLQINSDNVIYVVNLWNETFVFVPKDRRMYLFPYGTDWSQWDSESINRMGLADTYIGQVYRIFCDGRLPDLWEPKDIYKIYNSLPSYLQERFLLDLRQNYSSTYKEFNRKYRKLLRDL